MIALTLEAALAQPVVVCGEQTLISVVLKNTGDQAVKLSLFPPTVRFVVRGKGVELQLSEAGHNSWLEGGEPPRREPPEPFAPGSEHRFSADLMRYAHEELPPGRYQVAAVLRAGDQEFESDPVPFLVEPLHPGAVAGLWDGRVGTTAAAIEHRAGDNTSTVLVRSKGAMHPQDGSAVRVLTGSKEPMQSLGISIGAGAPSSAVWFAGIAGGRLIAGTDSGEQARGPKVELQQARLLSPGYRRADAIWFAMVGVKDGAALLQFVKAQFALHHPFQQLIAGEVTLLPAQPLAKSLPADIRLVFDELAETVHLVWAEAGAIREKRFKLGGAAAGGAAVLEQKRPLLAFDAPFLSKAGGGVVHALFGPAGKDGPLRYLRARLDGKGPPAEFDLQPPDDKVDEWGIGAVQDGAPLVLARTGTTLLVGHVSRPGWTRVTDVPVDATALRVIEFQGFWAEWFDPRCGLRHYPL